LAEVGGLPGDGPSRVLALRKRGLNAPVAGAAVSTAEARIRARARFPDADRLFFTPDALAQATSPGLAAYHAERLAPFNSVADLGCGAGMDSVALAAAGARVVAVERDPARLVFARANAAARGVDERITFVRGDLTDLSLWEADAAFWDPSRRAADSGGRDGVRRVSRHGELYEPPLSFLGALRGKVRGGCVKLSPALPDAVLDALNGRVEFLGEQRECKEACVWFGEACGVAGLDLPLSAVLLPERVVVAPLSGGGSPAVGAPAAFVHDPDPAVLRAGALATLAARLDARRISDEDVYLTSDAAAARPWVASSHRIVGVFPYKPRALRDVLRARGIGRLVVKKRRAFKEPEAVVRELGLAAGGGAEAVLVLVRQDDGGHLALLCGEPAAAAA
jgi:SAM-dependent methyltransferase